MSFYRNYDSEESREFWKRVDKALGLIIEDKNYQPGMKVRILKTYVSSDDEETTHKSMSPTFAPM